MKGLERVAQSIDALVPSEAMRAADLYETFLAGCYEKSGEVDDSDGELGELMQRLCCRWIRARQAAGAASDDTVLTLLHWMDRDRYGYTYELELKVVEVLDEAGLGALARAARARFDEACKEAERRAGELGGDASRHRWADVLRAVYRARRDALSYIRLCREVGLTAQDCLVVAGIFESYGETERALAWVRRGLNGTRVSGGRGSASYDLRRREKAILKKLGRAEEALALAWKDFEARPSTATYEELMEYAPDRERHDWHQRAMERARTADLWSALDLFIETRESERLAARLEASDERSVRDVSHYTLQKAAKLLEREHPDVAARLYRSLGMRIVDEGKSKYYRFALSHFARAKRCYEKAGLTQEWESIVKDVRDRHRRKSSFIPGFEKIARDEPEERSWFLDRAR